MRPIKTQDNFGTRIDKELKDKQFSASPALTCSYSKCRKSFIKPIELAVRTEDSLETYPACPYCFSRVKEKEAENSRDFDEESEIRVENASLGLLREMEMLSDTEGKYIYELATMYVPSS